MNAELLDIPADVVQGMELICDMRDSRSNFHAILCQHQSRHYADHGISQPRSHQRNQDDSQIDRNHHLCNDTMLGIMCVIASSSPGSGVCILSMTGTSLLDNASRISGDTASSFTPDP